MTNHNLTKDQAIAHLQTLADRMNSKNEVIPVYDIALEAVEMGIEALKTATVYIHNVGTLTIQ